MRFCILAIVAAGFIESVAGSSAAAIGIDETVHCVRSHYYHIRGGYHHNVAWPWPYICPDRMAVREPFAIMVENGWRRQNLLGEHHFTDTGDRLTTAGELKVRWIMTQAPPAHRQVFVERSLDPQVTEQRIAAAQDYAFRVTIDGQAPRVHETHLVSEGRPAASVDATNVRFEQSLPAPVLPPAAGGM